MIPEKLLYEYQAENITLQENEVIFSEKKRADYYFQLHKGGVKVYNLNEQGKEFVQGMFYDGESFGEPPLLGNFSYPATAIAIQKTELIRISRENFIDLLRNNFNVHFKLLTTLSKRLNYKAMIMKEISVHPPEHRILTLVDFIKQKDGSTSKYQVDLTRQQIADLTGLRVETVIRACKQLETEGEIEIINRKIHR